MAAAERWARDARNHDGWAPSCAIHPDVNADRVCEQCASLACGDCALVRSIRDRSYEACPSCRGILVSVGSPAAVGLDLPLPELPALSRPSTPAEHALRSEWELEPAPPSSRPAAPVAARAEVALELERPAPTPRPAVQSSWPAPSRSGDESGVTRVEGGSVVAHVERSANLFAQLPSALAYPLQGPGIFAIVSGTVFTWAVAMLSRAPIVGFIAALFGAGYFAAYMLKVIESSAHGQKQLPAYPDFTDWWDDILRPLFRVLSAGFAAFGVPCGIAALLVLRAGANPMTLVFAAGAGLLYFPMALVAVSVRRTFFAASPHIVLRMIVAAPLEYALACALVATLIVVRVGFHLTLSVMFPIVGFIVGDFVAFYLLLVELRVLGLIYHVSRSRLDWLVEA